MEKVLSASETSPARLAAYGLALGMVVMGATFAVLIGTDPEKVGALSHAFAPATRAGA